MENNKTPVQFGKTTDIVSYSDGRPTKIERELTETYLVNNLHEAQRKFYDISEDAIKSGKVKGKISATFHLNDTSHEVKRIEVSYTIAKQIEIPIRKSK